ncbi:VOC family protein [Nocardia sp. NPDC050712]|uniref:VOC family protein n=1 Tax=Nocardia sp. NPDC050712 TaxID=3155518 RepID=UPI0033D92312
MSTHTKTGRPRRDLDPRSTAHFIAFSDIFVVAVVAWSLYGVSTSVGYWEFPLCVVSAGAALLVLRMVLLYAITGGWLIFLGKTGILVCEFGFWVARLINNRLPEWEGSERLSKWAVNERGAKRLREPRTRTVSVFWYTLLGLGIGAQTFIVAGSNGIPGSPFTGILIATFVFGQFRAPTRWGIVILAGIGLAACGAARLIFWLLHARYAEQFGEIHYVDADVLIPLAFIAFMSTGVNLLTFEPEPRPPLLDRVGLVVEDLPAAIEFFLELGLKPDNPTPVRGDWADRVLGLTDLQVTGTTMRTPDGHGKLELTQFIAPPAVASQPGRAPVHTLGLRSVTFAVHNLEEVLERLRAKGADPVGEIGQFEQSYRLCYIRGPEGILVALTEKLG